MKRRLFWATAIPALALAHGCVSGPVSEDMEWDTDEAPLRAAGDPAAGPKGWCDCDDDDPCTTETCDEETGECMIAPTCNDGLDCTTDQCNPDGTCEFEPVNNVCSRAAQCVTAVCSATPPTPGPNQRVVPGAISGCFEIRDDGFCTNQWDGCACNGAEMCTGTNANPEGCASATPRPNLPCESPLGGGDGNACTEENCCEPWNPDVCRVHRLAQAATPGVDPPLKLFCDSVVNDGAVVNLGTPQGLAQCVQGDRQYVVPVDLPPIADLFDVRKPDGYWCDDCNPCTQNDCDRPTGTCMNPAEPPRTIVPEAEWKPEDLWLQFLPPQCTTPQFCDGKDNFGCGEQACHNTVCARQANSDNPDPTRSEQCHGFPAAEYDGDQIPPYDLDGGAQNCFELQCQNTGGMTVPNFECVALTHDELCENGLFCDGPAACSFDEICSGCNSSDVGGLLAATATSLSDTPPAAGSLIAGCQQLTPEEVCDDGIPCTVDRCNESTNDCVSVADERTCSVAVGGDWSPCEPGAACIGDVCESIDNPCMSADGCDMECIDDGATRRCVADPDSCGGEECFGEGYIEIDLQDLSNLCPFHVGDPPQGDRDFFGHGPAVRIDVSVEVNPADNHQILATVHFSAQETENDFSTIDFEWPPIVVADVSFEIRSIVSASTGQALGLSAPGGDVGIACGGCGIVNFSSFDGVITNAKARGDTPNDDISDDNNCNEDTLLESLELGTVEVFVRDPTCQG